MERTSFSIESEDLKKLNSTLEYGDNRSSWIRDAVKMKLDLLEKCGEVERMTDDERREIVVEAVQEKLEAQD